MNFLEKRIFVSSSASTAGVKRRRSGEDSPRCKTITYFLKSQEGERLQVCKTFFLTTLGYNRKNDRIITDVLGGENHSNILPSSDKRGKHSKTPKLDREL